MKIAFLDFLPWNYKVESAYQVALGGSQSAMCYLAEALAKQGHEVFLLNNTLEAGISRGVTCLPLQTAPVQLLASLDAAVVLMGSQWGVKLKPFLGDSTRLILWNQHAHDQPAVQGLQNPTERDAYDGMAMVSDWQRDRFHEHFNIDLDRTEILRNAIAPTFCDRFPDDAPILPQKTQPPILAYTSTPFRGLELLLDVFPRIRQAIPGTRLKVFSSMKVYHYARTEDEAKFGWLYRRCQEMEGVEYVGSVSQPELARQLQSVTLLAYPNTFAETSCIAVMEAMASGCWIVTSDLGALPETTAGFAPLVSIAPSWESYKEHFTREAIALLKQRTASDTTVAERHLRRQVNYFNRECTWSVRARQWVEWLSRLRSQTAAEIAPPAPIPFALKAINLIVFPDWHQSEETLSLELQHLLAGILHHPNRHQIALLVEASQIPEAEAELLVSGAMMALLMAEDLDLDEEPEIVWVRHLSDEQWSALLPQLHYRISLEYENRQVAQRARKLPSISCDRFIQMRTPIN